MKRKLVIMLASVLAMLAGLAPVSIAIWLAYETTLTRAESSLHAIAQAIAADTSKTLQDVDEALIALSGLSYDCTPEDVAAMNTMAYDIPEISDIGLIRPDRKLVCTSWGAIDPPVEPELPPPAQGFRLVGPLEIRMMRRYGLVALRKWPDGPEIGAVIHPSVIIGHLGADLGEHGFAVLIGRKDNHLFAWKGNVPEMEMVASQTEEEEGTTQLRAHFRDGVERTLVAVELEGYPDLYSVAAASDSWILRDWVRMALVLGAIGLGTSILLLLLVLAIMRRRLSLLGELQRSLQKNNFELRYQPVIDVQADRCVGAEVLINWAHPDDRQVRPDLFIPLAEDTGLIEPMTEWLMKQLRMEVDDLLSEDRSLHVAINLSHCHFESDRILETTSQIFDDSRIYPEQIIYEITERGLIEEDSGIARDVMKRLRARKSHIALDDFGTGYSSLSYISSFPLDYLKIDKSFVEAIGTNALTAGLVNSIIDMAKRLGLSIIAEGVERRVQVDYLREHGVEYAQGWYYSRAMPIEAFRDYVREYNKG
jgi:sensor c-di-GMP phosphodiesterase-like protein